MHEFNKCFGLLELAHDEGLIEEEEYTLKITPAGPIFNFA